MCVGGVFMLHMITLLLQEPVNQSKTYNFAPNYHELKIYQSVLMKPSNGYKSQILQLFSTYCRESKI